MNIALLDLFSGIGGFSLGLERAGFAIHQHYHSEIDKHANAIYQQQFPKAQQLGDVRFIRAGELGRVNAITFGSPCQDFSAAGKRAGLSGERSCLVTEAIRLIDELRPDFFIWENVKGAFTSNDGADFWAIIQAFAELGGYRLEWQLLNTTWFLPQNRERVYLVGRLAAQCAGDVFPLPEAGSVCTQSGRVVLAVSDLGSKSKQQNGRRIKDPGDPSFTLTTREKHGVLLGERLRRLTEIECERLQGFPDNWTASGHYDTRRKPVSATQRYKCLGNAVTVDVAQAVASQILKHTIIRSY